MTDVGRFRGCGAGGFNIMKLMGHSASGVSPRHAHPSTAAMGAAIRGRSEAEGPQVSNKGLKMGKRILAANS